MPRSTHAREIAEGLFEHAAVIDDVCGAVGLEVDGRHHRGVLVHGVVGQPDAVLVVDAIAEHGLDPLAVPLDLLGVRDFVEQALDDDHLPCEAPVHPAGAVVAHKAWTEELGPLRVDWSACSAELIDFRVLAARRHLMTVVGLERKIRRVVHEDIVAHPDVAQVLELLLADARGDVVAASSGDPDVVIRSTSGCEAQHGAGEVGGGHLL